MNSVKCFTPCVSMRPPRFVGRCHTHTHTKSYTKSFVDIKQVGTLIEPVEGS